jgi:CPA2 family monovalent cation:H+ antiporter-2
LLAGVVVGPFTPGFVADQKIAAQLSEIGVILLMFGVGLRFSTKDLLAMSRTVVQAPSCRSPAQRCSAWQWRG